VKHSADGDASPWRLALAPDDVDVLEGAYAEAVQLGFLGPREQERLWERHLDDAFGLAAIRRPKPGERWADLGSGAGLPGLPLALAHPATLFTLIDAHRRRLDWVEVTAARLHLTNISVIHARLEDYGRGAARESFDVATARALGSLPVVAELGLPLVAVGGQLLVPRGQPEPNELEQAASACEQLGGRIDDILPNLSSPIDRVGFVVIMAKIAATSPRFPRRSGMPARTPLGDQKR
jgi:16S rRNA (guanine527-N7)-methyltransferase